jgi:rubrerythrin
MDPRDFKTVRRRLEQAARLVASSADELDGWKPTHAGEEIIRRDLELVAGGLSRWCRELVELLGAVRLRLAIGRCPHCGWPVAPRTVERCPRCNGPREVRHENAPRTSEGISH